MSELGTLYLIPCLLAEDAPITTLPLSITSIVSQLSTFLVEDEKSARRFIRFLDSTRDLSSIVLTRLNEHSSSKEIEALCDPLAKGVNIGVLSEAGCPGIADPGALVVRHAHSLGAPVRPLVGPCSMILALMASGLCGQRWRFVGYPPREEPARTQFLRDLFSTAASRDESQIVMEAPYRNGKLFDELLRLGGPKSLICLAENLSSPSERIETFSIVEWKKRGARVGKVPALFIIGNESR